MIILFFGDLSPLGRTYLRKSALEELGNSVTAQSLTMEDWYYKRRPSLLRRVLWKVRFPPDLTQTNKTIVRKVQNGPFDIVWIDTESG